MPGRKCTICSHPLKNEIDAAIAEGKVSYRSIAAQTGLALSSVVRHAKRHLTKRLAGAFRKLDREQAEPLARKSLFLWQQVKKGIVDAQRAVRTVEDRKGKLHPAGPDLAVLAPLISAGVRCAELHGRVTGELAEASGGIEINQAVIVMPRRPLGVSAPASNLAENSVTAG